MGAVSVGEIKTGRTGQINEKNQRTYQRQFRVLCSSATDDQVTAMNAVIADQSLILGTTHPSDSGARCNGFSCTPSGSDDVEWTVSVSYSSAYDVQQSQPPTSQPTQYQWSFTTKTKIIDRDLNDEPILNSAGDPPEQGIEITQYLAILQVTKNISESNFDASVFWSYAGKCNAANFLGADAGQCQFIPQNANFVTDTDNGNYWQTSYSFVFDPDGHDKLKLLDQGFNKLDGSDKVRILDDEDEPVGDPRLLDGNGGELGDGVPPVYLVFDIIEKLNFGVFN